MKATLKRNLSKKPNGMSPYVQIIIGKKKQRCGVHGNGGMNPYWFAQKPLEFRLTTFCDFKLNVLDDKHQLIGESDILTNFHGCVTKGKKTEAEKEIDIFFEGKPAGTVYLNFTFKNMMQVLMDEQMETMGEDFYEDGDYVPEESSALKIAAKTKALM